MRERLKGHPAVRSFLDRVCSEVKGKRRKTEVREELLSHIEGDLADSGLRIEDPGALDAIIAKFGQPELLGRELRKAQRTWPQKMLQLMSGGAALSLLLLYLTSQHFIAFYEGKLKKLEERLSSRYPRFEREQTELSTLPFLRETTAVTADAGQILNSRLAKNDFGLPVDLSVEWQRDWIKKPIPTAMENADLTWMRELLNYDHWDFFKHGPASELIGAEAPPANPFTVPIPDLRTLQTAAKLRLRRALDRGNLMPALEEVRHMARLVYTTETLVGSMVAVALLRHERLAVDEAIQRNILRRQDHLAFSADTLAKMKTGLWVTAGFADFSTPEQMRRAFLNGHWPVGSCAALAETAQSFTLAGVYLEKKYPFERDLDDRRRSMMALFAASKPFCRLPFARQLLERPAEYANAMLGPDSFSLASGWQGFFEKYRFLYGRHLPFLRQSIGMELIAIARPDFSLVYDHE